jgi:hypothetical protein
MVELEDLAEEPGRRLSEDMDFFLQGEGSG